MVKLSVHQNKCRIFLERMALIQHKMLDLELVTAANKFDLFYKEVEIFFIGVIEQLRDIKKGESSYLLKKQAQLSLRNIKILQEENGRLSKFNDKAVILYFEKQLRFKKILKRQIREL